MLYITFVLYITKIKMLYITFVLYITKIKMLLNNHYFLWKKIEGNGREWKVDGRKWKVNRRKWKVNGRFYDAYGRKQNGFKMILECFCKYFRTIFSYYCFLIPKIQGNIM